MDIVRSTSTQTHELPRLTHNLKTGVDSNTSINKHDEITSVAQKFEALMLHSMLKSMRASIVEDELTGSDQHNMYRDMMDQEIAKNISESGGIGIQAVLAAQLGADLQTGAAGNAADKPGSEVSTEIGAEISSEISNAASKARLEQLQQYQKISGANDLLVNTQSSLMQD